MIYNDPNKFSPQKYNLRKNTRIFRFTIDSCSYRIRVSLEYDLTTSNILPLPHFLHSLLSLRPNSASISIFNPPPLPSTRDPCSPSSKLPSARWIFNFRRRNPWGWERFLVISFWCATWPDQISRCQRFVRSFRAERGFQWD